MKNVNINNCLIIGLFLTVISTVGAKVPTEWTVEPSDYRYDMSLYFNVTTSIEDLDLSQVQVAAFCKDECRGIAEILSLPSDEKCFHIRIRSNKEQGEEITFRMFDTENQEEYSTESDTLLFEANKRIGYPSEPLSIDIARYFDVAISASVGGSVDVSGGHYREGTELTVEATPAEGYSFAKWSDDTEQNPYSFVVKADRELQAVFTLNTYALTYKLDGEEYKKDSVAYGTTITPESVPEKEGYTFSGWSELPATMPSHDVTVEGVYTLNTYALTYKLDGEEYKKDSVAYGATITPESVPEKEGYTFSGWSELPATMPSHDVTVEGVYTVNQYILTLFLDGKIYKSQTVNYGDTLVIPTPQVAEGRVFDGWEEDIPETMPARDLDIHGTTSSLSSSISSVTEDKDRLVDIYTTTGALLYNRVYLDAILHKLPAGIYIVGGRKIVIK